MSATKTWIEDLIEQGHDVPTSHLVGHDDHDDDDDRDNDHERRDSVGDPAGFHDGDGGEAVVLHMAHRLDAYLRHRAQVDDGMYEATPRLLADAYLLGGVRKQCGVVIDDFANLIRDECEPHAGFFAKWMAEHPS